MLVMPGTKFYGRNIYLDKIDKVSYKRQPAYGQQIYKVSLTIIMTDEFYANAPQDHILRDITRLDHEMYGGTIVVNDYFVFKNARLQHWNVMREHTRNCTSLILDFYTDSLTREESERD